MMLISDCQTSYCKESLDVLIYPEVLLMLLCEKKITIWVEKQVLIG